MNKNNGVFLGLLAAFCFAILNVMIKVYADTLPATEMMFARGLVGLAVLTPLAGKEIKSLGDRQSILVWVRFLTGAIAVLALFYNIQLIGAGIAAALSNLSSVFVVFFSVLIFKEVLTLKEWLGVGLVLAGAFTLQSPFGSNISAVGAVVGLVGALAGGIALTSLKQITARYSASLIVWGFSLFCGVVALVSPTATPWSLTSGMSLFLLIITGLLGMIGQILITHSYAVLPATIASAVSLSSIIWSVALECIYFKTLPNAWSMGSYAAMLIGLQVVNSSNKRKKAEPYKAPSAARNF
jgi:drug/metabolite transporter (DMT)-like permease